jgi:hypothetical protein
MTSKSHFFIESGVFTQTEGFGPLSESQFNLTAKFSIATARKAFSICKGVVLVQPQEGSPDKVNLILRPFNQPYPGLNIKYFVYRGLELSSFFTNNTATGTVIPTSTSGTGTSDFINKINKDFNDYHAGRKDAAGTAIPIPAFTSTFIGFNPTVNNNVLLSNFFFKESEFVGAGDTFEETDQFELPMIDAGKSLGNFAPGECGIDVVLNYGDYQHDFDNGEFVFDLKYARATAAKITLSGTEYEQKLQREQTTQFIDITAFYGLYATQDNVVILDVTGTKTNKKGIEIYNEVINNFTTKNNWYIYIQSDRTRSYDFYGKYKIATTGTNNLLTGQLPAPTTNEVPMTATTFGMLGWPVMINTQTQAPTTEPNNLYLQLVTDNNVNTAFYGQIAQIAEVKQGNFINADGLRLPASADGNYNNLTAKIQLTTPATPDGQNIATLSILLYQGVAYDYEVGTTVDANGQTVSIKGFPNFFDDVFSLIKAQPLLKINDGSDYAKLTSQKLNLINQYYNRRQQGLSVVQTLTVNDVIETGVENATPVGRVTYLTESSDVVSNALSFTGSNTPDTKTSNSASGTVAKSKTYTLPEPYYYNLKLFTDSTQTITGLELKSTDGSTPTKIILGLTKAENETIKDLITDGLKNPRLFLIDLFDDDNTLLSPENIEYQKYKVGIVAENALGNLQLYKPADDVLVYSLDRRYHFSKGYSENMPDLGLLKLSLDLGIKLDVI